MLSYNINLICDFFFMLVVLLRATAVFCLAFTVNVVSAEPYRILASLRPLALVAQEVIAEAGLEDQVLVESVVGPGQSAHHLALRLSQLRRLADADLVVWIGPELEQFLVKPIAAKPAQQVLEFAGLQQSAPKDYHLWLSIEKTAALAISLGARLQAAFPDSNVAVASQRYSKRLLAVQQTMVNRFQSLDRSAGVLVYHESVQHLLVPLAIQQNAALVQVPEQQISMKTLVQVKSITEPGQCLLADVEEAAHAKGYADRLGVRLVVLDLLATDPQTEGYVAFMQRMGDALATCF